ncbi:hypothetical protein JTB14_019265 [Gonioctena quinquepunctata]|nr:hypothetical protein JTB14_019265 [Gonioctena quinquepunctata]
MYFYTNRKDAIDQRLRDIASEWSDSKTIEFFKHNFDMHSHESGLCEPVEFIKDADILEILLNCVGRKILSKIYERLVKNISEYISGMPDLFLWNAEHKKSKFVDVKVGNDKLSVEQKLWLKYLKSIGAHVEVCHVHSIGPKKKKIGSVKNVSDKIKKGRGKGQVSLVSPNKTGKMNVIIKTTRPKKINKTMRDNCESVAEKEQMPSSSGSSSETIKKSVGKINKGSKERYDPRFEEKASTSTVAEDSGS